MTSVQGTPHIPHKCACCIIPSYIYERIALRADSRALGLEGDRPELSTENLRQDALDNISIGHSLETARVARNEALAFVRQQPHGHAVAQTEINIYSVDHTHSLPGVLLRDENSGDSEDEQANNVFNNLYLVNNFFIQVFKRNSVDRSGLPLNGFVHYGTKLRNALWDGKEFIFGDTDRIFFLDFTSPIDVVCHEFMHGVTQYEANFIYWKQPGALNESMSDVFASLAKQYVNDQTADQANWLIGEQLLTTRVQSGKAGTPAALRSMADPGTAYDDPVWGRDPQPKHMNQFVDTGRDYGGVHINSGIPNHAFYLIAKQIGGYSLEKAGRIWYRTLINPRLRRNATFLEFALATISTARRLYGPGSDEVSAVTGAWRGVGVLGEKH